MAKSISIPTIPSRPKVSVPPLNLVERFVNGAGDAAPMLDEVQAPTAQLSSQASSDSESIAMTTDLTALKNDEIALRGAVPRATSKKSFGRTVLTRTDGTEYRKVTFRLELELDRDLTIYAATLGQDRSEIVSELIKRALGKKK